MFGGAAGGGKTDALLMAALQYVDCPDYAAILFRRTYADLSLPGALMDRAKEWLHPTDAKWSDKTKTWTFPSGATLTFGYIDTKDGHYRYGGTEFQYIGFDELTQFDEVQYRFLFSRLRRLEGSNIPLRMRSASNPGDRGHEWVRARFVDAEVMDDPTEQRVFLPARLIDNPNLDQIAYIASLQELDPVALAQLLEGSWDARPAGGMFERDWFEVVDATDVPEKLDTVRFWDLASTEASKKNRDPDYTAGLKLGKNGDGSFYVLDMRRARSNPGEVEKLVKQTAQEDGPGVAVRLEQEGMASGKHVVAHFAKLLAGFDFRGVPVAGKGSKVERARPVSGTAFNRNIKVVRGPWVTPFFDELEAFPLEGGHDDQVDTLSGAHTFLTRGRKTARLVPKPKGY